MKADVAIRMMVASSGRTPTELAADMGRGKTYVYSLLDHRRKAAPRLDTFALLAHACGYRLVLVDGDAGRCVELCPGAGREEGRR